MFGNYIVFFVVFIFFFFRACGLAASLAKMRDKDNVMFDEMECDIKFVLFICVLWVCMVIGLFFGFMVMLYGVILLLFCGFFA